MVVHIFSPSTGRQKTGTLAKLRVPGQPGLQSEFQDSQGYTEKPCLEKQKTERKKKNKENPNVL